MGSGHYVYRTGSFEHKATIAYNKGLKAISKESDGYSYTIKSKWREIYGTKFPN